VLIYTPRGINVNVSHAYMDVASPPDRRPGIIK
jgi:hypothetical protein